MTKKYERVNKKAVHKLKKLVINMYLSNVIYWIDVIYGKNYMENFFILLQSILFSSLVQ
jgi:hypothetical protein